jgi:predicted metal-dependent peptidase
MTMPYDHLADPTDQELETALNQVKGKLFFHSNAGWLGSLACNHAYKFESSITTADCDGMTIRFNPKFFMWLSVEERLTLLVHELWHTGLGHMIRFLALVNGGSTEYPGLFNEAADHVINLMIRDAGFVFGPKLMEIGPCMDDQYAGMHTEQIYEILKKDIQNNPVPVTGLVEGMANDLLAPPSPTDVEDIKSKIVAAHQSAERNKQAGDLPGEVSTMIQAMLYPQLPWHILLQNWMSELSRDEYSYARPNKRYDDEYLPSLAGSSGLEHLIHFLDVSGSASDEVVAHYNTEVRFIHETFQPKRLTVITFDTVLQDFYEWGEDDSFTDLEIHGRGGTDLEEVHDYLVKNRPSGAIIFTDLGVEMMPDPGVPIIWVVNDNPKAKVPFGKLVHIKTQ